MNGFFLHKTLQEAFLSFNNEISMIQKSHIEMIINFMLIKDQRSYFHLAD